jgi:hypothetical protein
MCRAAGDVVGDFVRCTACGATGETNGVFGSAVDGEINAVAVIANAGGADGTKCVCDLGTIDAAEGAKCVPYPFGV